MVGRSVLGVSHARSGWPCQDANLFRALPTGVALVAVADGLGSAPHSADGAQTAVRACLEALEAVLPPDPAERPPAEAMAHAFAAARAALEQAAADHDAHLRDLATTLLAAAWGPTWLLVGHIGDGAIVGAWNGGLRTISAPQRAEYVNVTRPLTADDALEQVYYAVEDAPEALALLSDGLQDLALEAGAFAPFEGFFRPLFAGIQQLSDEDDADAQLLAFLESPRVNERTDDDKTLVLIGRTAL